MKFFVDSNIIIETFKEHYNKVAFEILDFLLSNIFEGMNVDAYINNIVESEVVFQLIFKGKSSLNKKKLKTVLSSFKSLEIGENIRFLFWKYMEKHNLKPNDALILATCKHYNIKHLISLDEDFKEPCEKEGIVLINSVEKLKEVLSV